MFSRAFGRERKRRISLMPFSELALSFRTEMQVSLEFTFLNPPTGIRNYKTPTSGIERLVPSLALRSTYQKRNPSLLMEVVFDGDG